MYTVNLLAELLISKNVNAIGEGGGVWGIVELSVSEPDSELEILISGMITSAKK